MKLMSQQQQQLPVLYDRPYQGYHNMMIIT
jgi:hypothetical protein